MVFFFLLDSFSMKVLIDSVCSFGKSIRCQSSLSAWDIYRSFGTNIKSLEFLLRGAVLLLSANRSKDCSVWASISSLITCYGPYTPTIFELLSSNFKVLVLPNLLEVSESIMLIWLAVSFRGLLLDLLSVLFGYLTWVWCLYSNFYCMRAVSVSNLLRPTPQTLSKSSFESPLKNYE